MKKIVVSMVFGTAALAANPLIDQLNRAPIPLCEALRQYRLPTLEEQVQMLREELNSVRRYQGQTSYIHRGCLGAESQVAVLGLNGEARAVPICSLNVGDFVLTTANMHDDYHNVQPETGLCWDKVTDVKVRAMQPYDEYLMLTIQPQNGEVWLLRVTETHPFYADVPASFRGRFRQFGWTEIGEISNGTSFYSLRDVEELTKRDAGGTSILRESASLSIPDGQTQERFYDLTTEYTHRFFVVSHDAADGCATALVHNKL